jgi:hypothetical protein
LAPGSRVGLDVGAANERAGKAVRRQNDYADGDYADGLKKCPGCGKRIPIPTMCCPHCGRFIQAVVTGHVPDHRPIYLPLLLMTLGVLLLTLVVAIFLAL